MEEFEFKVRTYEEIQKIFGKMTIPKLRSIILELESDLPLIKAILQEKEDKREERKQKDEIFRRLKRREELAAAEAANPLPTAEMRVERMPKPKPKKRYEEVEELEL